MYCQYCGARLPDNSPFCSSCGAPQGQQQMNQGYGQQMNQGYGQQMNQGYGQQMNQGYGQQMNQGYGQQQMNQGYGQQQMNQGYGQQQMNQGYGQQMNQGYGRQQMDPGSGQPAANGPSSPVQGKKNRKKLILIISIAAVLLIGGGITAFLLLRNKGGADSPKAATQAVLDCYKDMDMEKIISLSPDAILNKMIAFYQSDFEEMDVHNAGDLKRLARENLNEMADIEYMWMKGVKFEIVESKECSREEIRGYFGYDADDIMGILEAVDVDQFAMVDIQMTYNGDTSYNHDVCYKYKGSWYSVQALSIPMSLSRYSTKSRKADDLTAAEVISSAFSTGLANEDVYDEVYPYMDGRVLFTAKPGEPFKAVGGLDMPASTAELYSNLGGATPKLKYTKNGQSGWAIGISSAEIPIVWISTDDDPTAYQLQPEIDKDYK